MTASQSTVTYRPVGQQFKQWRKISRLFPPIFVWAERKAGTITSALYRSTVPFAWCDRPNLFLRYVASRWWFSRVVGRHQTSYKNLSKVLLRYALPALPIPRMHFPKKIVVIESPASRRRLPSIHVACASRAWLRRGSHSSTLKSRKGSGCLLVECLPSR